MSDIKKAKANLLEMLESTIDQVLFSKGFNRSKKSIVYKKKSVESIQEIRFVADFFPRFEPGAEAFIHPAFIYKISSVSKEALRLVDGNKMLLAGAPEIILNQPIDFFAPKENHEMWLPKAKEDYITIGASICTFMDTWMFDFLKELQGIDGFIHAYESSDERLLKQQYWHVFVSAAYSLKGDNKKARLVMENHLGRPGLRSEYKAVYDNLSIN